MSMWWGSSLKRACKCNVAAICADMHGMKVRSFGARAYQCGVRSFCFGVNVAQWSDFDARGNGTEAASGVCTTNQACYLSWPP